MCITIYLLQYLYTFLILTPNTHKSVILPVILLFYQNDYLENSSNHQNNYYPIVECKLF
ncbi:hypothetical protein NTHI1209_02125 [Haemophilus influenzae]|uniref:Uncharacterized protein n=1 Tax=Haemophilus influenzae TaxID=727 RepID=A0A158T026_HAEIF|nr:hypothetical protein NTHI1209_02125 [Haemophilus influenzae]